MNAMRWNGIDHWQLILPEKFSAELLACRQWVRQNLKYVSDRPAECFARFYFENQSLGVGSIDHKYKDCAKEAVIALHKKEYANGN